MLDDALKAQLTGYLERLQHPVEIIASLDESDGSREMLTLLNEIGALSPRVLLVVRRDDAEIKPSFALRRVGGEARVRFAGVPMGHEFTSLVLALLQAGGHPPRADAKVLEQVRSLEGELRFETFVSLSCQSCPDVVQALNLMAVINPRVQHTVVDGALFQAEVERRGVMAVPSVFLNGEPFGQGRMLLPEIVAKLDTEAPRRAAEDLAARAPYDVLVVGGGPAGAAAAVYAARKGIRTGIAAERLGGQLLDTLGIENFISVKETEGHKLAAGLDQHVGAYEVDVMNLERAAALIPGSLVPGGAAPGGAAPGGAAPGRIVPGDMIGVELASGAVLRAKSVVIATGARWREINVPGEREYRNRGVAYCPHCDGPLYKGKRVAVIGGGNSGVEAAIDLAGLTSHVTLIEYAHELRADAVLQRKLRSLPNVTVVASAKTTEIKGDGERVIGLSYTDRRSGTPHTLDLAGVFVQIGLVPNTDWLKGVVKLAAGGEIEVNARGETSVPGVFAAGDCTVVPYKQIVIAVGEGAKAALSAFDYLIRSPLSAAA